MEKYIEFLKINIDSIELKSLNWLNKCISEEQNEHIITKEGDIHGERLDRKAQ